MRSRRSNKFLKSLLRRNSSTSHWFILQKFLWNCVFKFWFCFISNIFCPSIKWSCPRASRFNTKIVSTSDESDITTLSPITSPRISNDPIFFSVLFTPTNNTNVVVKFLSASCIFENSSSVVHELFCNSNCTSDWTSFVDLVHHILFTFDISELIN